MSTTISQALEDNRKRPINLLSLDAGGPRGISQLLILNNVMERLCEDESGDDQGTVKRPCEVFDMIGGVGTGGLIAIFLVVFKMTATEALDEFSKFVVNVFENIAQDPIEQTKKLKRAIDDIMERHWGDRDIKLIPTNQTVATCKLVVPIMRKYHVGVPCVLRNYVTRHELPIDLTIPEAMSITCSAPPMFTSTSISKDSATFEYVSGDLGLGNPTREVITEAHHAFGNERTVSCLLSIGCGYSGVNAVPNASTGTPWIEFLDRLARNNEKTEQDIAVQLSQLTLYHRLSVNRGLERDRVLEREEPHVSTTHTTTYLNDMEVVECLDRCVDIMKHGDGFTTLEQLKHSGGAQVLAPPLPPLDANYVERKLPMEFIEKAVFEEDRRIKPGSKRIIVTGIGGCGKTQLIRKFIEKYEDHFLSTFFIDGSSPDTIRRDIVRHVRALGGPHSQKSFDESMVLLSQVVNGERLLVIDNVDDATLDISPFLPRWRNGVVIVTSRNHSRGQLSAAGHLQLDVMTVDESVELLVCGSGKQWPPAEADRILAISVAEELGCHPIALVQAVSYMYNTGCSPGTYISLLRSSRDGLLRDHPATSQVDMRYKTAFAAFDASYKILPLKARNLWHLLSFFQWRNFPVELITMAALEEFSACFHEYLPHGDQFELGKRCLKDLFYTSDRWEPLKLQSTLASLRSHSLVTFTSVENINLLQMHPLVHEWGRLCIAEGSLGRFEAAAVRLLCCGASEDNYAMIQYLSGHVESLSFLWGGLQANDATSLGLICKESGMYEKCATLNGIAHEMVKHALGPDHPETIMTSFNLAVAYHGLGRYAEAEELETEVLRRQKQLLGVDHPDTIKASASLAATYHELGHYAEAEELDTEVLRRRKQLLGVDHPDTIGASANLAATYHALGRYAEAEELDVEVLRKRKQLLGVDHPDTIYASASLAAIYHDLGRYAEAEELKAEVLRRRKQLLGVDHPETIRASESLAATYHALGRHGEVEKIEIGVFRQRKQLLGVDHPDTIQTSAALAATYYALERYTEAQELELEVLKKRTALLGERHPDTIHSMLSLAQTYNATQRQSEASSLAQQALQLASETLGERHPLSKEISEFLTSLSDEKTTRTRRRDRFAAYMRRAFRV